MPEILPANEPVSEAAASKPPRRRLSGCAWVVICAVLIVATTVFTIGWPIYRANTALAALRAKGAEFTRSEDADDRPWYLGFVNESVLLPSVDELEGGVEGEQFTDYDVQHLTAIGNFDHFGIGPSSITIKGMRGLADLRNVGGLGVDHPDLSDDDLRIILQPNWRMHSIHLSSPKLTQKAWESIVRFKELSYVSLNCPGMTLDDTLPDLSSLTSLTILRLEEVHITEDGLKRLGTLPRGHHCIQLFQCRSDSVDFSAIRSLHELNIQDCDFTSADMSQFQIPSNTKIIHLMDLSLVGADPKMFSTLSRLSWLELHRSTFTDEHLHALASCANLQSLNLTGCKQVGDAQVPLFLAIPKLRAVNLTDTSITAAGIDDLKRRKSSLKVIHNLPAE